MFECSLEIIFLNKEFLETVCPLQEFDIFYDYFFIQMIFKYFNKKSQK